MQQKESLSGEAETESQTGLLYLNQLCEIQVNRILIDKHRTEDTSYDFHISI